MSERTANGRCLCGTVRFEALGEPIWVGHCHCQSCRLNTASAVATFVAYRPEQVRFDDDQRTFHASSPGVRRGFCARCGTPVSYESERARNEIHLYVASLGQPEQFRPHFHVFYEEKIDWLEIEDDLPRHQRTRGR